jgi:cell division protein DivIC
LTTFAKKETAMRLWNKFLEFRQRVLSRKVWRIVFSKYTIVTLIFLLYLLLDTNNLAQWFKTGSTLRSQERQIKSYLEEIKQTEEQLTTLQSKKDSIESFAREKYYFLEDGETVYIVE